MEKESKNLKAALTGEALSPEISAAPTTRVVKGEIGEDVAPLAAAPAIAPAAPSSYGEFDDDAKTSLPDGYYVQAGAFSNVLKAEVNGRMFYRVRVGPYDYHEEALVTQAKIRNFGIPAAHVVEN